MIVIHTGKYDLCEVIGEEQSLLAGKCDYVEIYQAIDTEKRIRKEKFNPKNYVVVERLRIVEDVTEEFKNYIEKEIV